MLQDRLNEILTAFRANAKSVKDLMRFDSHVIELVVQHLESLNDRLAAVHADSSRLNVSNTLSMIRAIHTNQSLEPYYRQMLNQCNVLLVSYFSSGVGDIFRAAVADAVRTGTRPAILDEEIKIDLRELREIATDLIDRSGELLAEHRQLSFQNLLSVAKSFRQYFGFERPQDEVVNDLIFAHACRHAIVHNAALVDRQMIGQVRSAKPRTLMPEVHEGDKIQFSEDEILRVVERMNVYLADLAATVGRTTT